MKINLTLLMILAINHIVTAQSNFFKTYKQPSHERAFASVQTSDGDYIIAGEKRVNGYLSTNQGYIVKLNDKGEIIKEELFDPIDASLNSIIIPYNYQTASFLCIGVSDSVVGTVTHKCIVFLTLDENLTIVEQKKYPYSEAAYLYPWQYCNANDSNLYLQYDIKIDNIEHMGVVKYQLPFNMLASYRYEPQSVPQDLVFKQTNKQLDVYDFFSRSIIQLDENLNYISKKGYSRRMLSTVCLTKLSDTNYLLTGTASNPDSPAHNLQIGAIKYNDNDVPLDSLYYTPSVDTNFYAGGRENTVISGNNIFITGFYNVHAMWFPYNYNPSWVTITKLDMDLNMISTHFYGGDAQYCPFSIIATSDGGCFVTGYSYDYLNNYPSGNQELDIFALKVNSDGLITDLPDHPEAKAHDAIVYPNPGRDYLTIQSGPQINEALFTLYDMQGRAMLSEKITATQLRLNTNNLPSGTYAWQIVFKNKVIESGKWVKE